MVVVLLATSISLPKPSVKPTIVLALPSVPTITAVLAATAPSDTSCTVGAASIPLNCEPSPLYEVAVTTPVTLIPEVSTVTAEPT